MRSVELFAGAGGLGMGLSRAGFRPEAVIEWDRHSCENVRANQRLGVDPVCHWPLYEMDAREFDFSGLPEGVQLISGGPPCQPFSIGGKHRGPRDQRDMFPVAINAVRELRPKAFIFENVKGLTRPGFARYFSYITLQLSYPGIQAREGEDWTDHLSRLEQHHTSRSRDGLGYNVVSRVLNAANHGVPQKRERVFFVGFRSDLDVRWSFPKETHSLDALLWSQYATGDYWERHEVPMKQRRKPMNPAMQKRARSVCDQLFPPDAKPWLTVRDALHDLPHPGDPAARAIPNHEPRSGARAYPGHTGSPLDEPAKTLKAGDHGVPGGENMLAYSNGKVRYFTVRESARLQTFPDDFVFTGSWSENMRQLGNAVPVTLAQVLAEAIRKKLEPLEGTGQGEPDGRGAAVQPAG